LSLKAGGDAEGFDRQHLAVIRTDGKLFARGAGTRDLHDAGLNRNGDVKLVWKDVEEPSDDRSKGKDQSQQADNPMGDHAGDEEGDTKRKHHGPWSGRREDDGVGPVFVVVTVGGLGELTFLHRISSFPEAICR
jgi:hypothetical protein